MQQIQSIQLPVLVTSLNSKVDGSIKVTLETREITSAAMAALFDLRGAEAWIVIAANKLRNFSLPPERPDPAVGDKTPSRRMRAVLYRLWEQGDGAVDFESYYRTQVEALIDRLKEKLA